MWRFTWLGCTAIAGIAAMHCSPPSAKTSRAATGAPIASPSGSGAAAECGPGYAACKHTSLGIEQLCYGQDPGPNAPRERRACTCDACLDDGECGGGKRCYLDTPMCGTPHRLCVEPCKQGACAEGFQCGDGFCVPRPMGGPP